MSPAIAKSKNPLDRLVIGAFTGGMLIVLIYGVRAIYRLFKKKESSKAIGESDGTHYGETHGRISPEKRIKPFFSWPNISFFICYGFALVKSIANHGDFTAHSFGASLGLSILPIIFIVIYNLIKGEAKTIKIISIAVNLLFFFILLCSTLIEMQGKVSTISSGHDTSTAPLSNSSSQTKASSSTQPTPETKMDAVDWYEKGNSLLKSGEYTKAIDAYGKAIDLNPQFADAYANRGTAVAQAYKFPGEGVINSQQAIRDFSKAIELDPNNAVFYVNRGHAYLIFWGLSMEWFAIQDFKKACELGNNNGCDMLRKMSQ